MLGVSMHSASVASVSLEDEVVYNINGPESPSTSGSDITEALLAAWKSTELISIEDSHSKDDKISLRELKEVGSFHSILINVFKQELIFPHVQRILQVMNDVKGNKESTQFSYALSGIGRDTGCSMQLVADAACTTPEELTVWQEEAVFNSLKVRLMTYRTVSGAISICKAADSSGWSVIMAAEDSCSETPDTFLVDFAVGVGAKQLGVGAVSSSEGCSKLNRLLEIYEESESIPFVGRSFRS